MINEVIMNLIKNDLKKSDSIVILHLPTEEEKEYLKGFNIRTEIVTNKFQGISTSHVFEIEMCRYYIEK